MKCKHHWIHVLPHVWDQKDRSGRDFLFSFSMCPVHLMLKPGGKLANMAVSREELASLGRNAA